VVGVILVTVAVIVGLVLLAKGFSDDGSFLSTGKKASSRATTVPSSATGTGSTTTTAPIDPATVHVFVANGSDKTGAASKVSTVLAGKGYPAPGAGNAATTTTTMVYFVAGAQAQAQVVASSLNLPATSVAPMPTPPPVANLHGATVLVVIGTDGALDAVESGNPTTTVKSPTTTAKTTTTKKS
jgi:LytR cell envelope-related transcriptional attenuator